MCRVSIEQANALQIAQACMLARIKNPNPPKEGQVRYSPDKSLNKSQRKEVFSLFKFQGVNLEDLEKDVVNLHGKQTKEVLKSVQVDTQEVYGEQWMGFVSTSYIPPSMPSHVHLACLNKSKSPLEKFMNPK